MRWPQGCRECIWDALCRFWCQTDKLGFHQSLVLESERQILTWMQTPVPRNTWFPGLQLCDGDCSGNAAGMGDVRTLGRKGKTVTIPSWRLTAIHSPWFCSSTLLPQGVSCNTLFCNRKWPLPASVIPLWLLFGLLDLQNCWDFLSEERENLSVLPQEHRRHPDCCANAVRKELRCLESWQQGLP